MTWRAHVRPDLIGRSADIFLVDASADGHVTLVQPGGILRTFMQGESTGDAEPTLTVPEHALPALLAALSSHLGAVEHPQQLRADYVAERARVDKLIDYVARPPMIVNSSAVL